MARNQHMFVVYTGNRVDFFIRNLNKLVNARPKGFFESRERAVEYAKTFRGIDSNGIVFTSNNPAASGGLYYGFCI